MTKREAMRRAHAIAWNNLEAIMQQSAWGEDEKLSVADRAKVTAALEKIVQRHFVLSADAYAHDKPAIGATRGNTP